MSVNAFTPRATHWIGWRWWVRTPSGEVCRETWADRWRGGFGVHLRGWGFEFYTR